MVTNSRTINSVAVGICIVLLLCLYQLYKLNTSITNKGENLTDEVSYLRAYPRLNEQRVVNSEGLVNPQGGQRKPVIEPQENNQDKGIDELGRCKRLCPSDQHICTKFCDECRVKYPNETAYPYTPCVGNDGNFSNDSTFRLNTFDSSSFSSTVNRYPFTDKSVTEVNNIAPHHTLWKSQGSVSLDWGGAVGMVDSNSGYTQKNNLQDDSLWQSNLDNASALIDEYVDEFHKKTNNNYILFEITQNVFEFYLNNFNIGSGNEMVKQRNIYDLTETQLEKFNKDLMRDLDEIEKLNSNNIKINETTGRIDSVNIPTNIDKKGLTNNLLKQIQLDIQ